jgi:hypothetical protein
MMFGSDQIAPGTESFVFSFATVAYAGQKRHQFVCRERSRFVHWNVSTLAFEPFREVLQHVDGTLMPTVEVYAIAVTHMQGFDLEDYGKALIVSWHIGGADNPIVPPPTPPS